MSHRADEDERSPPAQDRQEGFYTYEYDGASSMTARPLSSIPQPSALPADAGQSNRELATHDNEADMRRLTVSTGPRDRDTETFIVRQLPSFAGTYNGDLVRDWVDKTQILKNVVDIPEAELIRLLPLCMSTRAAEFLEGYLTKLPRGYKPTWDEVKTALLTQYGGMPDPTVQLNKLHSAKMGRDIPVREFAQQIERLARLSYPELTIDTGDDQQREVQQTLLNRITLEQFVSGLPPLLSRTLVERKISDFTAAVDTAAHLEAVNARFMKRTTINALHDSNPDSFQYSAPDQNSYPVPVRRGGRFPPRNPRASFSNNYGPQRPQRASYPNPHSVNYGYPEYL